MDTTTAGGRLVFHLFGALAWLEREIIPGRTVAGLRAARARGRVGGRPSKLTAGRRRQARKLYAERELTVERIGNVLGVRRTSVYRAMGKTMTPAPRAGPATARTAEPAAATKETASSGAVVVGAATGTPVAGTSSGCAAASRRRRRDRCCGPADSRAGPRISSAPARCVVGVHGALLAVLRGVLGGAYEKQRCPRVPRRPPGARVTRSGLTRPIGLGMSATPCRKTRTGPSEGAR